VNRLARLAARRSRLLDRIADQRAELARAAAPLQARLRLADQGITAFRSLRRRPGLIVLGALLVVAVRPRRVYTWLKRGWRVWKIGQALRGH
jgi:hypothetical protein